MPKLLPFSSSTPKPFITSPATRLFFGRFLSQSFSNDLYDPPFSPKTRKPNTESADDSPLSIKPTGTRKKPKKTRNKDPVLKEQSKGPVKSDLPFDFRYSYSETDPNVEPIGYREPKRFSPFGPGRLDRKWTGICAVAPQEVDSGRVEEERERILGDPLTEEEVADIVEKYRHSDCNRQINLGNHMGAIILGMYKC